MGKILTNSQGKAIIASGNAFAASAALDANIIPGNIKDGVEILGVTGNYQGASPNLQTLNVTPSTSAQQLTPTSPVDGYNEVNVSAVTSAIDQNIVAGNIKKDVAILGVTGTYEGGGVVPVVEKDVNFYDYDGTLLYSYTAQEFANLSAMPANPTHTGLTAQGWNWSLSDAKTYVAAYGKLIIGQMYITSDGKTRLYISVGEKDSIQISFKQSVSYGVTVDWGDGNEETFNGTGGLSKLHQYELAGDYIITFTVSDNVLLTLPGTTNDSIVGNVGSGYGPRYILKIKGCHIGNNVALDGKLFNRARLLSFVTIPRNTTITQIPKDSFRECIELKHIAIPTSVTTIGSGAFSEASLSKFISLPNSITTIDGGTSGSDGAFYRTNLPYLMLPESVTVIPKGFMYYAYGPKFIVIPNTVTTINDYAFSDLNNVSGTVIIPSSVTSIGSSLNSSGISKYVIKAAIPPTLGSSSAFNSVNSTQIIVPTESVETYKAASQWSNLSSKIIGGAENY